VVSIEELFATFLAAAGAPADKPTTRLAEAGEPGAKNEG
jgi:hypothetical protein